MHADAKSTKVGCGHTYEVARRTVNCNPVNVHTGNDDVHNKQLGGFTEKVDTSKNDVVPTCMPSLNDPVQNCGRRGVIKAGNERVSKSRSAQQENDYKREPYLLHK